MAILFSVIVVSGYTNHVRTELKHETSMFTNLAVSNLLQNQPIGFAHDWTPAIDFLNTIHHSNYIFREYPTLELAIVALDQGHVKSVLGDSKMLQWYLGEQTNRFVISQNIEAATTWLCIGFTHSLPNPLIDRLNALLITSELTT